MLSIPSGIYNYYHDAIDYLLNDPNIARNVRVFYEETVDPVDFSSPGTLLTSEDIKLRVYTSPKSWLSVANVQFIDGRIQVLGYMTDAEKLKKSSYIEVESGRYILATNPMRHGFGNRYFVAFLDLVK